MFRLIAIDFSQKSPHFSLLSPTSPCELSEREVTSPSNLKVVGALDNYSLVFVIFINFFGQLKDWVRQVLFLVSCLKGQVEKYVDVEAWYEISAFSINSVSHGICAIRVHDSAQYYLSLIGSELWHCIWVGRHLAQYKSN